MPESEICCGLFWELLLIRMVPDCEPFELGVKVTFMLQLVLGAMVWLLAQEVP